MMDFTNIKAKWQLLQGSIIEAHAQYATIYYPEVVTGSSVNYDGYFKESTDPLNPETRVGVTTTTGTSFVVSGIIIHNPHSLGNNTDGIAIFPIGVFQPDSVIFTCKISDATVSGVNKFDFCKYVVLSTDSTRKYQVLGTQKDGLFDPYVLHVHLGKSIVESN